MRVCCRSALPFAAALLLGTFSRTGVAADSWTLMNPTGHAYSNELVRLKLDVPEDVSHEHYRVLEDGREVAWQPEMIDGSPCIWVATDLTNGQTHAYTLEKVPSATFAPRVSVVRGDGHWILDSDTFGLTIPAEGEGLFAPIATVRLPDGRWVGTSFWSTTNRLTGFTSELVGDGALFAKVRLRYTFEGMAGVWGTTPAYAEVDILLPPGRSHAVIEESHEMSRGSYWELDCAAGWEPRQAVVVPHHGGFGRPTLNDPDGNPYPWPPRSLAVGQTRMGDTLLNLWPRWSQAYDDGWFFMAHDGETGVGAMVVRAGKWYWPHNNGIEIKVRQSADYAGLRCPTWRGRRYWFLVAGSQSIWEDEDGRRRYAMLHAYEALDKLHQEYILDWPGLQAPEGTPPEAAADWSSGAGRFAVRSNPFPGWQNAGPGFHGERHPIAILTQAQVLLDPDSYGNYWLRWSPENPNFATAWIRGGIWAVEKLSGEARYWGGTAIQKHPRYDDLVELARQKMLEDMYHSVTLPSGAGQECHGYMAHAMHLWEGLRYSCQQMGFDPMEWPYVDAARRFLVRVSYPVGDGTRRCHPGGDTHPPGPNIAELIREHNVPADFASFTSEELEGFGAVFRSRAGTPSESYLAFKSGPNRGHFHGDQLSLHYAPYGMLQAPDHHCSYGPRAGQEHMHNRVAFHTDAFPYANMDGYERLIAFKAGEVADAAIGQVESDRLRAKNKFPPEEWDRSLPQLLLDPPLAYRRTVVFVRNGERDYVVLRDQHAGPELSATYCLHVYGDTCEQRGSTFDFDGLHLAVAAPAEFTVSRHDWEHYNGGREATVGLRLTTSGRATEFITVIVPKPRRTMPVTTLTLKDALFVEDRRAKSVRNYDLTVILPWKEGNIDTDRPYILTPGIDKQGRSDGTVKVLTATSDALELELSIGVPGRKSSTFRVSATRDGATYAGTYTGSFGGRERQGAATGSQDAEGLSPKPQFADFTPPVITPVAGGVRVGDDEIVFAGGISDDDATHYVEVRRGGETVLTLTGEDIDMNRSQGHIGLFVPDAGYPFGVIPDWLIRQRDSKPDWYRPVWPLTTWPERRGDG